MRPIVYTLIFENLVFLTGLWLISTPTINYYGLVLTIGGSYMIGVSVGLWYMRKKINARITELQSQIQQMQDVPK